MTGTNKMIGRFENKPQTQAIFNKVDSYIHSIGNVEIEIKSQISYKLQRKFCWMWSYEKTKDGTLFLAFLLDEKIDASFIHAVTQVSKNRWNHNVVLKSLEDAEDPNLREALSKSYHFANMK